MVVIGWLDGERILHLLPDLVLRNETINIFTHTTPIKVGRESVEGPCNAGMAFKWR